MKQIFWLVSVLALLTACSGENRELAGAMSLRDRLLDAEECCFQAEITADYGDTLHSFSMDCRTDNQGNLSFEVTAPDDISGIKGTLSDTGGTLDFEDTALYFDLLTDDQLPPVSAPWILMKGLRSGCITAVCMEEQLLRITVDDSYAEDALKLDVWVNGEDAPVHGDILYDGKRILSLDVGNFVFS